MDPSQPPPPSGRRLRLSALVLVFAGLLLVTAWGSVAALLRFKREEALRVVLQQNRSLARVLAEQTLRVMAAADQALQRVVQAQAHQALAGQDLVRFANETGLAPKILVQLSLIDAQGRFTASNLDPDGSRTGPVDLSGRDHVRAHLQAPARPAASDYLYIGPPVLGKVSNRWTIQLTRALRDAQGRINGVVVASLDPSYFEQVYAGVDVGHTGSVALIGKDLVVRARVLGGQPEGMGSKLPASSSIVGRLSDSEGSYRGTSGLDGVRRTFSFRQVADLPLYTFVSSGEDEALEDWRNSRDITLGLCTLLSLTVMLTAGLFVSGLRRLERNHEALRLSEAQAQAANQAKSEFLAAISHELRTPLTSIRGYAELMEKRLAEERYREAAGMIRKGAEHLNALLTEILDLAKVEAGSMDLHPEPVDLQALLVGSVDFFMLSAQAKGLTLTREFDPALPPAILCDGLRLKQILNNLLSNAIKFTAEGGVRLRMAREGDTLLVQVIDTGPGIPPEQQALIFEKFRQGDATVSYQHGGTGLGLALSRALAELMQGELSVSSRVGEGACFSLRVPLREPG